MFICWYAQVIWFHLHFWAVLEHSQLFYYYLSMFFHLFALVLLLLNYYYTCHVFNISEKSPSSELSRKLFLTSLAKDICLIISPRIITLYWTTFILCHLPYITNLCLHTAYFLSKLCIPWSQELCFIVEVSAKFSTIECDVKIFKSKPPIYQASKIFVSVIVRVLSWTLSRSFGSS